MRGREEIARAGGAQVRAALLAAGIPVPIDEGHAGWWNPPLSVAETRHRFHLLHETQVDECRFCRQEEGT